MSDITALLSCESNEWYTPARYVQAARELMGDIDLDPASCADANRIVQATRYYTQTENGLLHPWIGRIWLNPPYGKTNGKSNQEIWSYRLIGQYLCGNTTEAVLLVNASTGTSWFARLLSNYPVCFTDHRITFWRGESGDGNSPTQGNAFFYLGPQNERFYEVFRQFGTVARCISAMPPAVVNLDLWS